MVKNLSFLVLFLLLLPLTLHAEYENLGDHQYQWLYTLLIPEELRNELPSESFKSFRVHLQDTNKKFGHPLFLKKKNLIKEKNIQGLITYAGIIRKKYSYDYLITEENDVILKVKIHLQNPTASDRINFADKLRTAEKLWNDNRIPTDFSYYFKFELVTDKNRAHFSVKILDETRGPYDVNWGRSWTGNVIAHEVGHMLGLGDEYQTLSGKFDCLKVSLMCSAWKGKLMKHNYYFILRRLLKSDLPPGLN